jgi:hypothetical protein
MIEGNEAFVMMVVSRRDRIMSRDTIDHPTILHTRRTRSGAVAMTRTMVHTGREQASLLAGLLAIYGVTAVVLMVMVAVARQMGDRI